MINKGCNITVNLHEGADIDITGLAHLLFVRSVLAGVVCRVCCLLAPVVYLRPRCLLQNWDLLSSQHGTAVQTQLIGRTLHACSDLARSVVVQKHCQYGESCVVCPVLLSLLIQWQVRINDHIIPVLAGQVTVSVLRFICVDLKILTALFGIFLQYQLNCYWLDHKTCWTCTVTQHTSHLTDYAMDRTGHHSFQWKLLSG